MQGFNSVFWIYSEDDFLISFHKIPVFQGAPANVRIFELSNVSQAQSVARRSFFKSNTAQLMWNKGSTGCLVLAQSDVDKTNQSYYGETRLHFLTSDGCHEGAVPLSESS